MHRALGRHATESAISMRQHPHRGIALMRMYFLVKAVCTQANFWKVQLLEDHLCLTLTAGWRDHQWCIQSNFEEKHCHGVCGQEAWQGRH